MTPSVTPFPAVHSSIPVGGASVVAMYGPLVGGGLIVNPSTAADQGIDVIEALFVSLIGPAGLVAGSGIFAVQPGGSFVIPPGTATPVWVNAATSGHTFSAIAIHDAAGFVPFAGTFPPEGPTTVTKVIKAYLYQEYADDDDLQAFFRAFNELAQSEGVDWFVDVGLPIYTGLSGDLLDWVAAGLYGMLRPALPSGRNVNVGPLNTWVPNLVPLNTVVAIGNQNYAATSDDVFKRILTWHFYKGDGKVFTIRWLKRRIVRFLDGANGASLNVDQTYRVSVTFGVDDQVNINLLRGRRTILSGALPNRFALNTIEPNQLKTSYEPFPSIPLAAILKSAIESGALELPFQFTYVVNVL